MIHYLLFPVLFLCNLKFGVCSYNHSPRTNLLLGFQGGPCVSHSQKNHWFPGAQWHHGCEVTSLWCCGQGPLKDPFKRDFQIPLWDWVPAFYSAIAVPLPPTCHWNCLIEHQQVLSRREILIAHFLCFLNDLNCLGKEASILNLHPTRGDSHSNKI